MAEKKYIDAEALKDRLMMLQSMGAAIPSGSYGDPVSVAINIAISQALDYYNRNLIVQLTYAIDQSMVRYDRCMLCARRDDQSKEQ